MSKTLTYNPEICPVRHVLDQIGDKWAILVLTALKDGDRRFGAMRREVPDISQRMLTKTLRTLQRDGYVWREATDDVPPAVTYGLTPLGQSLTNALAPLAAWALEKRGDVAYARAVYDNQD